MGAAIDIFGDAVPSLMASKAPKKSERVPQSVIDTLLEHVSLIDLIKESTHVKSNSGRHTAHCPFHARGNNDYTLTIDNENDHFSCSECDFKGSAIGWLMFHDGLSFQESVYMLAQSYGVDVSSWITPLEIDQSRIAKLTLLADVAEFFSSQLKTSDEALAYLRSRGLSDSTIDRFGIGFAPSDMASLEAAFPKRNRDLWSQGLLVRLSDGKFSRRFRDRIMFPIRNAVGDIVGFGGRALDDTIPKYLNSPSSPLFSKSELLYGLSESLVQSDQQRTFVLVEGYVDVLSLHQAGFSGAIATLGTSPSEDHLKTVFSHCDSLVACFDGDSAGVKAAERLMLAALPVLEDGQRLDFVLLPAGDDPDSIIRDKGAEEFERCLSSAVAIEEFFHFTFSRDLDLAGIGGKSRLATIARPHVQRVSSELLRLSLIEIVEESVGIPWYEIES